ncbi:probable disease resistance RPP8-like protein 2 [Eucalyptus grandis]|uniref:probable disease resistance RPP8-like protein 2 n=1 Tax=Eucalyptus grandis TaxID=71139 RepID=UPI00192EE949|nr:probable disease resistance RPP8-like protein 2 [Eucalyptus grandis]XP_039168889.1 probable disease resistance RPP8-like protein 2 [Eucalyptus grandis]XP_039168890.1 probable disease resistance RPP8-like protein 2 [Eucalyptus grandis]XP_039168891.1 probable disease resistance RPP8-like protein 2 [Eucalyptus grandis]XP_039168892.1 probable disease resistance RPP8-like protein 2 [Eucalyptus grandis]XP_039168893.1 probable disease resistance RPP8-like protein 2 [Eucalyptus grandis]XP_03916889
MAESVVSSVGQTIGKLLVDEAKFLRGVEGKVKDLHRELGLVQGLLRDADARREHNETVREWVAQLRDSAYDAEDVIERYFLKAALTEGRNIIKAYACFMAKCSCVQVHDVGTEIDGLKSRISDVGDKMQKYGIRPLNEGERKCARVLTPQQTYAHFEEEDFVGREDGIEELVKELKDGKHTVVALWGMGGLGKTTHAKRVFNHDKLKNHFTGFAWACISQEYHVRDILEGILVKLIPDKREKVREMRNDDLLENLYTTQKRKRCIVVLDDIWTKQAWDGLRAAFPVKYTRSKLLITTRNKEVAEYINPHCFLHELQCLSHEESWVLLKKRAFPKMKVGRGIVAGQAVEGIARQSEMEGQIPEITEDKKKLGDELLKKCGGLPLAVIVLGGLLAVNKWETVHRNINLYFCDKSDVFKVLAFSYDDLPWNLKPCFIYLASFPEDVEIPVKRVLRMWIAEGFVPFDSFDEEKDTTIEDVVEQYLMELVKRGLVQVRLNLIGNVKTCHLHDLMRDLCVFKARQEKFLSFHKIQQDNEREGSSSSMATEVESTCETRRLSLYMRKIGEGTVTPRLEQIRTMPHVRTLMFFHYGKTTKQMWQQVQPIFINCKFLRVLALDDLDCVRGNLPRSVGDLVHLRFLSLARSKFEGLPQSMGNLVCMEFLDLFISGLTMVSMPNVLSKMRRLRYLRLPCNFAVKEKFHAVRKELRLGTLQNLRTLRNFSPKKCNVNDISKLINLQNLTVIPWDDPIELEIFPQLVKFKFKYLRSSSFYLRNYFWTEDGLSKMSNYCYSCKLSIRGKIKKLPEHKSLPEQLRKLVLLHSRLEEDPMLILEKLPHLVVLMLGFSAFLGNKMVCSAGGFPQLKHLLFHRLIDLEEWRAAKGAMPHLSRLGISYCPYLRVIPSHVSTYDCYDEIWKEIEKEPW